MKQQKILLSLAVLMSALFYSCNNDSEKKEEPAKAETPATAAPAAPAAPEKPGNFLLITHKVANYAKWLPLYESDDSARKANGLTNFVLGRGIGADSNTVLVALKMADTAKAKAFGSSPGLKEKMKQGGVIGAPLSVNYTEAVWMDTSTNSLSTRVIVTHKVKDWDAWKKEFDSHKQVRMDAGLVDRSVGHSVDDTHNVIVVFAISDMAKAKAFMASKDLKDKMAAAGVTGPPSIFYYTVAKKY